MKKLPKLTPSVLLLGFATLFLAFTPEEKPKFKNNWKLVGDKLYAAVEETTVFQYNEFLNDIRAHDPLWESYKLDSTVWKEHPGAYVDPLVKQYNRHPAFNNYPALGMTHKGAIAFCEWLTEKVNEKEITPFKKVLFRLPTESEWEAAAAGGLKDPEFPWLETPNYRFSDPTQDKKGRYRANFKIVNQSRILKDPQTRKIDLAKHPYIYIADDFEFTSPVKAYEPNPLGIYDIAGNVAEMIAEPGLAKGGSWHSTGYYLRIKSQEKYKRASSTVGFRVFMEVIEE